MTWLIYKHTCLDSGKIYVGYTSKTLDIRWRDHVAKSLRGRQKFYAALRKYGTECWLHEILQEGISTLDEAETAERHWIKTLHANDPSTGYNMTEGGDGGRTHAHSPEHRQRMSARMTGARNPRAKLSLQDVEEVRSLYASGSYLQRELAERFGVNQVTISGIITGRLWR